LACDRIDNDNYKNNKLGHKKNTDNKLMATKNFYFCDYCKKMTDTLYIDECTGNEVCSMCWSETQDDEEYYTDDFDDE
jgi:hypothetical protein